MTKKINYEALAKDYEEVLDLKNEVIDSYVVENKELKKVNKFLENMLIDDEDEITNLRKQVYNLKVDRITSFIIIGLLIIGLILK